MQWGMQRGRGVQSIYCDYCNEYTVTMSRAHVQVWMVCVEGGWEQLGARGSKWEEEGRVWEWAGGRADRQGETST